MIPHSGAGRGGKIFEHSRCPRHPCLGFGGHRAYSAAGGKLTMSSHTIAESIKQQISLLDYLASQAWQPTRRIARGTD
jgi:hypothetical protein